MREIDALEFWRARGSDYFRELSTFGALPDNVVRGLLQNGRVIELDEGEYLYNFGEQSDSFYIVLSGTVATYMPREDGGWTLARCHETGDDMGFVPMIALTERPGSTKAEVQAVVLEVTSGQLRDLQQQEPDAFGLLLLNLMRGMARAIINMAVMLEKQDSQLHEAYSTPLKNEPT